MSWTAEPAATGTWTGGVTPSGTWGGQALPTGTWAAWALSDPNTVFLGAFTSEAFSPEAFDVAGWQPDAAAPAPGVSWGAEPAAPTPT